MRQFILPLYVTVMLGVGTLLPAQQVRVLSKGGIGPSRDNSGNWYSIEADPENPLHLKTVRGAGYLF